MDPWDSRGPASAGILHADITIDEPAWRRLVPGAGAIAVRAVGVAGVAASIVLTSDRAVRRLNARDRGQDKPTNVLTYPAPMAGMPGEIFLALGTVLREAAAAGRRPAHHLAHLVVHGALHLAGHDHHHAGDARRMERMETKLLHRLRVPNPWRHQ